MTKVLVIGAYGLIGAAVTRALGRAGFDVIGLGRSAEAAQLCDPDLPWHIADATRLGAKDWRLLCAGVDVVVNAAGALQTGGNDSLDAIHIDLVTELTAALAGSDTRIIQISAAGVSATATTAFFRSKARGDAILQNSGLDHVILRPTLVLGQAAYGGTALLRAAAAVPMVSLRLFENSRVQTIDLNDVATAVVACAAGQIASGTVADLTEDGGQSFPQLVAMMRRWHGFNAPILAIPLPKWVLRGLGKAADLTAWFGWRSPLRSTSLTVLQDGVQGDPATWRTAAEDANARGATAAIPTTFKPLDQTLATMPARLQDRWFARLYLLFPITILSLALFWLTSGAISIWQFDAAQYILTDRGIPGPIAAACVAGGIALDLLLGAMILFRRTLRYAALGMVATCGTYLIAGSLLAPDIWADPLGPFVKILPAAVLALLPLALAETR